MRDAMHVDCDTPAPGSCPCRVLDRLMCRVRFITCILYGRLVNVNMPDPLNLQMLSASPKSSQAKFDAYLKQLPIMQLGPRFLAALNPKFFGCSPESFGAEESQCFGVGLLEGQPFSLCRLVSGPAHSSAVPRILGVPCQGRFFPAFGVGLLDFELSSSPRRELFSSPP